MNHEDDAQVIPPPGGESPAVGKLIVPFEDPSKDFFSGLIETIKLVLFKPTHFFRNYKLDGSIGRPLLFAVMIGWTTAIIGTIWATLMSRSLSTYIHDYLLEHLPDIENVDWDQVLSEGGGTSFDFIISLIIVPVFIMIGLFIVAGIYHLFLLVVKGANKSFETTFNVLAYGAVAHIAEIIPLFGGIIAWIYGIVLGIIGISEAHKTDSWKAAFAVFGPYLLCCVCCGAVIVAMGGTGFLSEVSKNIPWN
jgi:hypothetical protein